MFQTMLATPKISQNVLLPGYGFSAGEMLRCAQHDTAP